MKVLQVKVKPNARTSRLEETAGGHWEARLKSPPVDGRANQELIELVATHFRCPRHAVTVKSGRASRMKLVQMT